MALVRTARGSGNHNASALTFTLSPGSNFAAGMAVLCIANDNAHSGGTVSTTYTVTDTLGNTWSKRQNPLVDPGAASAGAEGAIFTTLQNGGLLTTGTVITVTFDTATTAKAWTLDEVKTNAAGGTVVYVTGNIGTSGTGSTSPTITSTSIAINDIIIGMVAVEAGTTQTFTDDADSTNGSWTASQSNKIGSTTSGMAIISQTKIVTAAGAQTFNPTLGILGDLALAWVQLHEALDLAPALLNQAAVATAPVVSSLATVAPALLNQAATATAPTVSQTQAVTASLLNQAAVATAPVVSSLATVAPALLNRTAVATAPVVSAGAVSVAPALLNQAAVATAPVVTSLATVAPALLDRTAVATAPVVAAGAVSVAPALLDRTATATAPTLSVGGVSVAPALVDRTAVATAPTVGNLNTVAPALLNQAAVATAPVVAPGAVTVAPALIDRTATATTPTSLTVGAVAVAPALLNQVAAATAPVVSASSAVAPALIDRTAVATAPTLSSIAFVALGLIDQAAIALGPDVHVEGGPSSISPALLDRTATTTAPTVTPGAVTVAAALLDASASATAPSVSATAVILAALINQSATALEPIVGADINQVLELALLDASARATAPVRVGDPVLPLPEDATASLAMMAGPSATIQSARTGASIAAAPGAHAEVVRR